MSLLRAVLSVACLSVVLGCGAPTTATSKNSGPTVDQVCEIAAKQMGVDRSKVSPGTSLEDLGADELDLIEMVMDLEDHFGIMIPEETIEKAMGTATDWKQGQKFTMAKLAAVVDDLKSKR
jgi:acyl carrier protein